MSRGCGRTYPYPTTKLSTPYDKNVQDKRLSNRLFNKEEEEESALKFYKSVWPELNKVLKRKLINLIKEYGQDLFNHAVNVAASNGVTVQTSFSYLSKILKDWQKHNVTDVKSADAYMNSRNKSTITNRKVNKKKSVKESLPNWARDDYKPPKEHIDASKKKLNYNSSLKICNDNFFC